MKDKIQDIANEIFPAAIVTEERSILSKSHFYVDTFREAPSLSDIKDLEKEICKKFIVSYTGIAATVSGTIILIFLIIE